MVSLEGSLERAVRTLFCLLCNKHGYVSLASVGEMMQAQSGNFQLEEGLTEEDIRQSFERMDLKKTNEISYSEFQEAIMKWMKESGFQRKVESVERYQRGILTRGELVCFNELVLLYFFTQACDSPLFLSRIKSTATDGMLETENWTTLGVPYKNEPNTVEERNQCFKQMEIHDITKLLDALKSKNLATYQEGLNSLNTMLIWTDEIQEKTMRFQFLEESAKVLGVLWKEEILIEMVVRILNDFSPHVEIISSTLIFLSRVADYIECSLHFGSTSAKAMEEPEVQLAKELRHFMCSQKVLVELIESVSQIDVERFSLSSIFIGKVVRYDLLEAKELVSFELHQFLIHGFFSTEGPSWDAMVNGILGLIRNYPELIKSEKVVVNGHLQVPIEDALSDDLINRIQTNSESLYPLEIIRVLLEHCSSETAQTIADKLSARLHYLFLEETNIALRQLVYNIFKKFLPLRSKLSGKNKAAFAEMINLSSSIVGGSHDIHYHFYKEFGHKLRAEALDFLFLCTLEDEAPAEAITIKQFLNAPDDTSFEFLKVFLGKNKSEMLLGYQGLVDYVIEKLGSIRDLNGAFKEVFGLDGAVLLDSNKVHVIFFLMKLLIDNNGVFPLNYGAADLISTFLKDYVKSLESAANLASLKMEGVHSIANTVGVVVIDTLEWLSHSAASSERTKKLKEAQGHFKNKMKLLKLFFQQGVQEEEKISEKIITAKCRLERTDIDYEGEEVKTIVFKFPATEPFPDFALNIRNNLDDGEMIDISVNYHHSGDTIVVQDQVSYDAMLTAILEEGELTEEYRCDIHVLYSLEEDYDSLKIHCMNCGLRQQGSRQALIDKQWKCVRCGEEKLFLAKYD